MVAIVAVGPLSSCIHYLQNTNWLLSHDVITVQYCMFDVDKGQQGIVQTTLTSLM